MPGSLHTLVTSFFVFWLSRTTKIIFYFCLLTHFARQDRQNGNFKNKQNYTTKVTKTRKNEVTKMTWAKHLYDVTKQNIAKSLVRMTKQQKEIAHGADVTFLFLLSFPLLRFQNSWSDITNSLIPIWSKIILTLVWFFQSIT